MILGQTHPYLRRKAKFGGGDTWGTVVAQADLVRAALEYTNIEGVHFLLDKNRLNSADLQYALDELKSDFPDRNIKVISGEDVVRQPDSLLQPYVFSVVLGSMLDLLSARSCLPWFQAPVSGMLHSIPHHLHLSLYLGLLLLSRESDIIVSSSSAGTRALAVFLTACRELIDGSTKASCARSIEIVTIPLGVDPTNIETKLSQIEARRILSLPEDSLILLHLGRISEASKADLEPLLLVVAGLRLKFTNVALVIAGRAPGNGYISYLQGVAARLNISDRVFFRPDFPFSEKPSLYRAADIFVSIADNIQETFGLVILEAMAAGLPVVASDWSGYRDLVQDSETGFLIPTTWSDQAGEVASTVALVDGQLPLYYLAQNTVVDVPTLDAKLNLLLENRELRLTMGSAGVRRVQENYVWSKIIRTHMELWEEQHRRASIVGRINRTILPIDYNAIYRHFATNSLVDASTIVSGRRANAGTQRLSPLWNSLDSIGPSADKTEEIGAATAQKLSSVEMSPRDAVWLLKKGLISQSIFSEADALKWKQS
jgi:glycosyltransferase involved in cell wall biosynthesis